MKDRNEYIHEQRVVQLRTYQSIADEVGLTRERRVMRKKQRPKTPLG